MILSEHTLAITQRTFSTYVVINTTGVWWVMMAVVELVGWQRGDKQVANATQYGGEGVEGALIAEVDIV